MLKNHKRIDNMRVITGSARGRVLKTLQGDDVRPTTDRVKEAVFSIIQFEIEGRRVLDLFAGSGQLGIEALSRGAQSVAFVDISKDSVSTVKYNLEHTRLSENARVFQTDALSFLKLGSEVFDIVFLDPPYNSGLLEKALELLPDRVAAGGVVMCETPFGADLPDSVGSLTRAKSYKYGKIMITVYRKEAAEI